MGLKTTRWDAAEHLNTNEEMASYLEISQEEPDPELTRAVLGDVARAMGLREIAKQTGIDIKELNRAFLTDDETSMKTIAKVIRGLGGKATVTPRKKAVVKSLVRVSPTVKRAKRKAS